jgi:thioredoxin-related protein
MRRLVVNRIWAIATAAVALALSAALPFAALAQTQPATPRPIDIPPWFAQSFLDLSDEVAMATQENKRLLVYFGQDGCPYCRRLMEVNFSQRAIVDKTRANFKVIALDIWGDLEVTAPDGQRLTEKQFAKRLEVQFTPTLLFFDEQGRVTTRLNGYWPPHRFSAALDYVIARQEAKLPLADYLATHTKDGAHAELNEQPFLMKPPFLLRRGTGSKPLAVLFETRQCQACDEMHGEGFQLPEMRALIAQFDIARFALGDERAITAPDGRKIGAAAWARELKVTYTPTVVFFDEANREVFRFEGYLRPFHLIGAFDYVAQRAYRGEPEFQRFLQARAQQARARGQAIDLWR